MTRLLPLLLAGACATAGLDGVVNDRHPDGRAVVSVTTGELSGLRDVARDLASVRHVYVGELHDSAPHHAVQLEVAELLRQAGRRVTIGVEWLPASANPALEAWVAGRGDEAALLRAVDWQHAWGQSFDLFRPIFAFARRYGVPLVGLNPAAGLAEAVAVGRTLPPALQAQLPPLDTGNEPHRKAFLQRFLQHASAHGHGHPFSPAILDRYYRAQLVRDETMALGVLALAREDTTVVVFAGLGHIDNSLGIPERAAAGLAGQPGAGPFRIVLPLLPGELQERGAVIGDAPYPTRRADWLWEAPRVGGDLAQWTVSAPVGW